MDKYDKGFFLGFCIGIIIAIIVGVFIFTETNMDSYKIWVGGYSYSHVQEFMKEIVETEGKYAITHKKNPNCIGYIQFFPIDKNFAEGIQSTPE